MSKFYKKKKKNIFGATIAILLVAVIAGSVLAYFFNSNFKSKVHDILKIEETTKTETEKSEAGAIDYSAEIESLKNQLDEANKKASQLSNLNYIINSNFTINQQTKSTYYRNGEDLYSVDRWYLCNGNGTFKYSKKTLTGSDETAPTILCQWIEDGWDLFLGKTVTCSATINGVRKSATVTLVDSVKEVTIYNLFETDGCLARIYIPDKKAVVGVQFLVENGTSVVLEKVKFEISEFETKYIEPTREEETRRCLRYFQKVCGAGVGYSASDTSIYFFVPTSGPLRTMNSIIIKNAPKVLINGALVEPANIITSSKYDNVVSLLITDFPCEANKEYPVVHGTIYIDGEFYIEMDVQQI